jgi:hypothetical protein
MNNKKSIPRHIISKLQIIKDKNKILIVVKGERGFIFIETTII